MSSFNVPGLALLQLTAEERLELYTSLPLHQRERLFAPWQVNRLPGRAVSALAASLAALIYAVAVLVLAGAMLVYDLLLVALAALTPAAALLALWPPWGGRLATAWAGRLLAAALGKAIAALLLGAFFSISVALLEVSEPGGWPLAAVLFAALAVALWRVWLYRRPASAMIPRQHLRQTDSVSTTGVGRDAPAGRTYPQPVPAVVVPVARPAAAAVQTHSQPPGPPSLPRPKSVLVPVVPAQVTQPRHEFSLEMTRLRQQLILSSLRETAAVRAASQGPGRQGQTIAPPVSTAIPPEAPAQERTAVAPVAGGATRIKNSVNTSRPRGAPLPDRRARPHR